MKKWVSLATLLLLGVAWAATLDEAKQKYAQRGYDEAGIEAAKEAVDIAQRVADQTGEPEALLFLSKAIYFVGSAAAESDKDTKVTMHDRGLKAADKVLQTKYQLDVLKLDPNGVPAKAVELRGKFSDLAELIKGLYLRSINLGGWANAMGIEESLNRLNEMMSSLNLVNELDEESENFGASRVLGRVFHKIGMTDDAGQVLEAAFENTLHDQLGISTSATTNVYYAEYLNSTDQTEAALRILQKLANLTEAEITALDPDAVPETKGQIEVAKKRIAGDWN